MLKLVSTYSAASLMAESARDKRKGFVQTLRALSDKCRDVVAIRDDSGKEKVEKSHTPDVSYTSHRLLRI